jgi:hypothetical protein
MAWVLRNKYGARVIISMIITPFTTEIMHLLCVIYTL